MEHTTLEKTSYGKHDNRKKSDKQKTRQKCK